MSLNNEESSYEDARQRWKVAQSFKELCLLTAEFIEGKLPYFPDNAGDTIDEETIPLIPYLSFYNHSGFLTSVSQPGLLNGNFRQRAFVQGFSLKNTALDIARITLYSDLYVAVFPPNVEAGAMIPVTVDEYHPYTWAGFSHTGELSHFLQATGPVAANELRQAWSVTIVDVSWGRVDFLWETLKRELDGNNKPYPSYSVKPHPELGLDDDIYTFG